MLTEGSNHNRQERDGEYCNVFSRKIWPSQDVKVLFKQGSLNCIRAQAGRKLKYQIHNRFKNAWVLHLSSRRTCMHSALTSIRQYFPRICKQREHHGTAPRRNQRRMHLFPPLHGEDFEHKRLDGISSKWPQGKIQNKTTTRENTYPKALKSTQKLTESLKCKKKLIRVLMQHLMKTVWAEMQPRCSRPAYYSPY